MAQRLKHRTLYREKPGSNPGDVGHDSLKCMIEYRAIDRDGYIGTNIPGVIMSAWLRVFPEK